MKKGKRILACAALVGMLLPTTIVGAEGLTRNGPGDCTPSITLYATKATFQVWEGGAVMNPITAKKISGSYKSVDILGHTSTQPVNKSLSSGQLQHTVLAPANYKSTYANMAYYLNGVYSGSIERYY